MNTLTLRNPFELSDLLFFGSDQKFPPYNIIANSENLYSIEVALAGYSIGDLKIEARENVLVISGEKKTLEKSDNGFPVYVQKGISNKEFSLTFRLAKFVEVKNAYMHNGMLTIVLERIIPEEKQPKFIPIEYKE